MKKYFEKFKDLKSTNKKLYYATICMFVLIGFTFAYVIDQISGGAISRVFITADTADNLQFEVDKDISIKPTQFNFTQGGVDLSDTATATARLKANSTDNTAKYTYNVYFQITTNEYIYTTEDKKPEMILQVINPNGENLTELDGLTYNETLQGFDITNLVDFLVIAENYEISSSSSTSFTEQKWIITVKFINLDTNQIDNEGKSLEGKILIQKDKKSYGDINIAVSNLPETYGPLGELTCDESNSIYDIKTNEIIVNKVNARKVFCNLYYTARPTKVYLNNYIIGLSETTQGTGQLVHETFINDSGNLVDIGYRYEGQDPNNYVWFNNELWRIIGVMDEESHGQVGLNLVKLIRNESIGGLAWNASNTSNWNDATLKALLNTDYLESINGTNSNNCYGYSTTSKSKCNYTTSGIKDEYRNMIKEVTWYLGGYSSGNIKASKMFEFERDATSTYSGNPASTNAKVGLMYASDYGFAVPEANCNRSKVLSDYDSTTCTLNNWLYGIGDEWTISPSLDYYFASFVYFRGHIKNLHTSTGRAVRPTVYLESNVYVIDGNGTITNPYIIGM